MRKLAFVIMSLAASVASAQAPESRPDPWAPVTFLVGSWAGTASGEPGTGTVLRSYESVLGNCFIYERNTSTYPPQEKNAAGEVHEHWSLLSFDRDRGTVMFRQFHQEGFVNVYALDPTLSTPTKLVFESERIENIKGPWKARETYDIVSNDEFTETFELAPPDKPFEIYCRNHFKRVGQ